MSVKEMDVLHASSYENDRNPVLKTSRCEPTKFNNSSYPVRIFEALQSLYSDEILCDIKLETDNGTIVIGHKVVLVSACLYFSAMFCSIFE